MCIAVIDLIQGDQRLHSAQLSYYVFIDFVYVSAREVTSRLSEDAVLINKIQGAYSIECTDIKILDTMVRCCVHRSGSGLGGYVLT